MSASGLLYVAELRDGVFAAEACSSGNLHERPFRGRGFDGPGKCAMPDGTLYDGEFRDGKLHGPGRVTRSDGTVHEGQFRDGKLYGPGTVTFGNGEVHEGEFQCGELNGPGRATSADGSIVCEGKFRGGEIYGPGKVTFGNGQVHEGEFLSGALYGPGKVTFGNGEVHEGEFLGGALYGPGTVTLETGAVHEGNFLAGGKAFAPCVLSSNLPTLSALTRRRSNRYTSLPTRDSGGKSHQLLRPAAIGEGGCGGGPKEKRTRRGHRGGKKKAAFVPEETFEKLCNVSLPCQRAEQSSIGGQSTCIVCFEGEKTHMSVPCGHICVCAACSGALSRCPYCRQDAHLWVKARVV
jgi:hypothetical protein